MSNFKYLGVILIIALGSFATRVADSAGDAVVTPLLLKDLLDIPGKEALMITVEYPPGGADPIHRHDAHALVYVLEGAIVMQVKGSDEVTLTPGQTFDEGPATFIRSAEMPVAPSRRSFWCCC
jgi:quercetin dioxygenase-like cupin family protein